MEFSIGSQLDEKNQIVVKSILKLRAETWVWVDNESSADIWITEIKDDLSSIISATKWVPFVIFMTSSLSPEELDIYHHLLAPPIRPSHLLKLLDLIVPGLPDRKNELAHAQQALKQSQEEEKKIKNTPPPIIVEPGEHSWAGRNIRFKGNPDFSRYPITAELAAWLEIMYKQPVSYDAMSEHLTMDSELLETVLNSAAKGGELVDEHGAALPPNESNEGPSLIGKLFGKK